MGAGGGAISVVRWAGCRFYGFSCAQTQYYFHEYPKDKAYLKIFVRPTKPFLNYWLTYTRRWPSSGKSDHRTAIPRED